MKKSVNNIITLVLLGIIIYLFGSIFPINSFFNNLRTTPTSTPIPSTVPTTIPTITEKTKKTDKPIQAVRRISTVTQIIFPTIFPRVPVYLSTNNKTYNCKPEGVDAIKSADTFHSKVGQDWKSCISMIAVNYANCTNQCAVYDPSEDCKNNCEKSYGIQRCPTPNFDNLQSLINQYCQ